MEEEQCRAANVKKKVGEAQKFLHVAMFGQPTRTNGLKLTSCLTTVTNE